MLTGQMQGDLEPTDFPEMYGGEGEGVEEPIEGVDQEQYRNVLYYLDLGNLYFLANKLAFIKTDM